MNLVLQDDKANYEISQEVSVPQSLSDNLIEDFKRYGLSEISLRSAHKAHPIIQYLISLHSIESRIKVVNIIKRVAKLLEPDIIFDDSNRLNIFTFPWQQYKATDLSLMLDELSVTRVEKDKNGHPHKVLVPASQATRRLYKSIFKQVMVFYADAKLVDVNDVHAIDRVKVKATERPLLGQYIPKQTQLAVTRYLNSLRSCRGMRDAAIFSLLLFAGLRRSEIGLIKYSDINFKSRELTINGKGDKRVTRPLFDSAWEPLKAYIDNWEPQYKSHYIFTAMSKSDRMRDEPLRGVGVRFIINEICAQASVEPIAPHDLRRTFCTDMIEKYDVSTAQYFMRHANLETTQRYNMKLDTQMAQLRDKESNYAS